MDYLAAQPINLDAALSNFARNRRPFMAKRAYCMRVIGRERGFDLG
jgi:hypothetical protein